VIQTARFGFGRVATLVAAAVGVLFFAGVRGQSGEAGAGYKVIAPVTQGNLTVFPVIADVVRDTKNLITLDEGLRSGQVVITENGGAVGLQRRGLGAQVPQIWSEQPSMQGAMPRAMHGATVNQLALMNNSGRPLILLAGEIVTGGKQDRVVGKDRIIGPKSDPVALSVFCVEPHRWVETSANFGGFNPAMAQPSVRAQALSAKDQQGVWNEVAKSRAAVAGAAPMAAPAINGSSSYAAAMQNSYVQKELDAVAAPIDQSYEKLMKGLRAQQAVGAVIAINGEVVWADVFANPELLEKYWPKLIRSYAAEAIASRGWRGRVSAATSTRAAQEFLDGWEARRESVESEPGVYRNTELIGDNFDAFVLTSLLPGTGFNLHIAKMKR
jgi:hypothetical protein